MEQLVLAQNMIFIALLGLHGKLEVGLKGEDRTIAPLLPLPRHELQNWKNLPRGTSISLKRKKTALVPEIRPVTAEGARVL